MNKIATNYHVTRTEFGSESSGWTSDPLGVYPAKDGDADAVVVEAAGLSDGAAYSRARAEFRAATTRGDFRQ